MKIKLESNKPLDVISDYLKCREGRNDREENIEHFETKVELLKKMGDLPGVADEIAYMKMRISDEEEQPRIDNEILARLIRKVKEIGSLISTISSPILG